jgi:ammonium transporter, Amt family
MRMRWKAAACSTLWAAFIAGSTLVLATAANADEPAKAPRADLAALAAGIPEGQTADALLVMACAALALLMIPAVGLFYAGMVRRKNVLSAFQQTFVLLGVVPLQWVLFGYGLSFGPDLFAGFCGGWQWFGLNSVGLEPIADLAPRFPHQVFMIFEMLVAVFAAVLISGALAERMKFASYVLFALLWTTFVYDPVAHWVWSPDGWLRHMGTLDFGGGLVIHLTSGLAALCCALALGQRKGLDHEDLHPHNLTLSALGTALLWFGWLGVVVGQARGANTAAAAAFVATILGGCAGILGWTAIEYAHKHRVTMLGACTGAVAGLVAVTPAAGYVTPVGALVLGAVACPFCYGAIRIKGKMGYDDSLDVFGVNGVGALVGTLALGFVAAPALTRGAGGLLNGNANLLFAQVIAVVAVAVYTIVVTVAILTILDRLVGLRVSPEEEDLGLDLTQHGQRGYMMGEGELIGIERD